MKKYILSGVIAAFLSVATIAHAPRIKESMPHWQPRYSILAENTLEKNVKKAEVNIRRIERKMDMLTRYETDSFYDDAIDILVARLMMGEDEAHPPICKIADAWTALNRTMINNTDLKTEILRPGAYSCFNLGTESHEFLRYPLQHCPPKYTQEFSVDLELAKNFLYGKYNDPTHGATSYYNPNGITNWEIRFVKGLGKIKTPRDWNMDNMIFTVKIGEHLYFKEKDSNPKISPAAFSQSASSADALSETNLSYL